MSLLNRFIKILVVAGALAFYWNYGRTLFAFLSPLLPQWLQHQFIVDWIGLIIIFVFVYILIYIIERRMKPT